MIGLVLVSHSARLAEGVAELAAQMAGPDLAIAVAGGLDLPGKPLGTDAALVAQAIERVWSSDGVLVLMDLGSAVLSAELALDLLPHERRAGVLLCDAPLVEGAVAAAVAAALGGSLESVAGEARGGLAAKVTQLAPAEAVSAASGAAAPAPAAPAPAEPAPAEPAPAEPAPAEPAPGASAPLTLHVVVANRLGLHARPAARLVRAAAAFDADVTVEDLTAARGPVSARSLNAVAALGAGRGHELLVRARGLQAGEALAAIARLAADDFGDAPGKGRADAGGPAAVGETASAVVSRAAAPVEAPPAPTPVPGAVLQGMPGSPGIVVGRARGCQTAAAPVPDRRAADPQAEWATLQSALEATAADLRRARGAVAGRAGGYDAAIFDAHLLFLSDEALLGPARAAIFDDGRSAAAAWTAATVAAAGAWEAVADPYLRSRVADLRGVADGVLRHLVESPAPASAAATASAGAPAAATASAAAPAAATAPARRPPARRSRPAPAS